QKDDPSRFAEIKFVLIPHSGMFVVCSLLYDKHCLMMPNSIFLPFIFLSWRLFKPASIVKINIPHAFFFRDAISNNRNSISCMSQHLTGSK
ncbi:MAG: hypothetical protein ACREOI_17045, partial [bacterium]